MNHCQKYAFTTSIAKSLLILFALVNFPVNTFAAVYQSVDAQGNVVYSDQPSPNAQTVNLPQNKPPSSQNTTPSQIVAPLPQQAEQTTIVYKTLTIQSPSNDQTIWDNNGNVPVAVALEPNLAPSDTIELILDGQPVASSQTDTHFSLEGIDRGTHILQARIVDKTKKVIKVSNAVTIYIHKATSACNSPLSACPNGQCGKEIAFLAKNPICQQLFVNKAIEIYQSYGACQGSCAKKVDVETQYGEIKMLWIPQIRTAILNLRNTLEICKASSCNQLPELQRRYQISERSRQLFKSGIAVQTTVLPPAAVWLTNSLPNSRTA